ncbi:MAG: glycosyltransferase family 2 protein [Candidatus Binataceae bacterium]
MPRVSVIVPVFNAERTLARALDSIIDQSYRDFELIVVDDGSTDHGDRVLTRYSGRLRAIRQSNGGPSAARNAGVRASGGEYLAFLDADDWWRPEMLAGAVQLLDRDPKCVLAYCDLQMADSEGREFRTVVGGTSNAPSLKDMLAKLWPILPSGVLIRRSAYERVGGFPEQLTAFEDVYLWLLLREQGHFAHIAEPLAVWRFALFPDPLKRAGGQETAGRIFCEMVQARYGVSGAAHVVARQRAPRTILAYIGLQAMADGDNALARRAMLRALRVDPLRLRNYLRLLRTFLPARLARALSGRRAAQLS